jgi:hypothetical protein
VLGIEIRRRLGDDSSLIFQVTFITFLWTGEASHDANLPVPSTPTDLILADLDADPYSSYVAL